MTKAKRSITFLLTCLALLAGVSALQAERKPNVLFYLTDDLGYGDVGCYGAEGQDTQAIDQLAKEGTKFSTFYVHQRNAEATQSAGRDPEIPQR